VPPTFATISALLRRRSTVPYTAAFGSNADINRELPDIAAESLPNQERRGIRLPFSSRNALKKREMDGDGFETEKIRHRPYLLHE
jgi:hypothetical protein